MMVPRGGPGTIAPIHERINRWVSGFAIERHLVHRFTEAQPREQVSRGIVARLAPEHDLGHSPGMNPGDRRAHELSSGALATPGLVDVDVVDESTGTAQVPPAGGLD